MYIITSTTIIYMENANRPSWEGYGKLIVSVSQYGSSRYTFKSWFIIVSKLGGLLYLAVVYGGAYIPWVGSTTTIVVCNKQKIMQRNSISYHIPVDMKSIFFFTLYGQYFIFSCYCFYHNAFYRDKRSSKMLTWESLLHKTMFLSLSLKYGNINANHWFIPRLIWTFQ